MCGFPKKGNFGSGNGYLVSDYKGLFPVRFHHVNKSQKRRCSASRCDHVRNDGESEETVSEYALLCQVCWALQAL